MEAPGGALAAGRMTATAEEQAAAMVAAVRDDPARRLELAARFYDRRIGRPSIRSYRRAELAFMRWQISRGILAAPSADRPGSPWWRAVNEGLLRDAWQAQLLESGQPGTASRPSVACWVRFLRRPSAQAWYRAHNASIVAGYLAHRGLSGQEHPIERFFMDVALIRVLYAHAASELNEPQLLGMIRDGWPVYAWPYDQRQVWIATRAPLAIRILTKLTANTGIDQSGRAHRGEDDGR